MIPPVIIMLLSNFCFKHIVWRVKVGGLSKADATPLLLFLNVVVIFEIV